MAVLLPRGDDLHLGVTSRVKCRLLFKFTRRTAALNAMQFSAVAHHAE